MGENDFDFKTKQERLRKRFRGVLVAYLVLMVLMVANYSLKSMVTVGVIIGSIYPFMSFLYLYKNYVSENEDEAESSSVKLERIKSASVMNWIMPTFFLHMVVIFGLCGEQPLLRYICVLIFIQLIAVLFFTYRSSTLH